MIASGSRIYWIALDREHGGQIRVRSEGEWGAIFTVILPIRGREDRRSGGDRRRRLIDRRDKLSAKKWAAWALELGLGERQVDELKAMLAMWIMQPEG